MAFSSGFTRGHGRYFRWTCGLVAAGLFALTVSIAEAQWGRRWRGGSPRFPTAVKTDRSFAFARVMFQSFRREPGGYGWSTDYPLSDANFMIRLSELTTTPVSLDPHGNPNHVVVRLTDPELFDYPFVFMSDVGTVFFTDDEAGGLRRYLEQGGFLWVDDFWGPAAWDTWRGEIRKALPSSQYPITDLSLDHPIFSGLFDLEGFPQIPSIQHWRRSGGVTTSERGVRSAEPHFRGISDEEGRLMVLMTHNTDIADGWEREGEDTEYFHRFSIDAYAVGINVLMYAMTH